MTVENEDVNGVFYLCKLVCKACDIYIRSCSISILISSNRNEVCIVLIICKADTMKGDQVNHLDVTSHRLRLDLQILKFL